MTGPVDQDTRYRVMRMLEAQPDLSQREMSRALGISLGSVNYCLRALIDKGQVKVRNFRASNNKLRYAYILTPKGAAEKARLTAGFLRRKRAEYDRLREEIEALERDMARTRGDG
ncbi:MarR family EPS-associated transcriptional regulator [Psychromarinibacter sp. C21-152]|uniref:MarR family EPS-associated transcriptional regulator n=1 Tax=Psychromarinibacter sediminicola TaxID=3033385 RepID=A0AAE3NL51_9RHOB|nr:MarR family EPS-associated transcriptional regulator [Psychromarinibacter sediminicola]MDF0599278.1 MarR family EPS-associated transcriptional regulator [Psychromarinibacter sediminicola]